MSRRYAGEIRSEAGIERIRAANRYRETALHRLAAAHREEYLAERAAGAAGDRARRILRRRYPEEFEAIRGALRLAASPLVSDRKDP